MSLITDNYAVGGFEDYNDYSELFDAVEALPAADMADMLDVQSVVHAEWENVNPVEVPLYRCSACGHTPTVIKTNFCPDCGAKMRGEA